MHIALSRFSIFFSLSHSLSHYLIAEPLTTQPGRNMKVSTVAILGFQFGLYHACRCRVKLFT